MKSQQIKFFTFFVLSLLSLSVSANEYNSRHYNDDSFRVFSSYESNGLDYIEGIGIGTTFRNPGSDFGVQFNTSFNVAEILATDGFVEDYFSWQASAKFGLFSNFSAYIEAGIDLTEVIFRDLRYEDNDDFYEERRDDIDTFFGIGVGLQAGQVKIEGFTRLREIDSKSWEAESEVFTGVQFSIEF